jgi:hypothetical protein
MAKCHNEAIRLNTGRNALNISPANSYQKINVTFFFYLCLLEPLVHKIDYEFYYIDEKFEPVLIMKSLSQMSCCLYYIILVERTIYKKEHFRF